jgi:Arylsulfotransferase (ASST)
MAAPVLSPAAGSPAAMPGTEISFLGAAPGSLSQVLVVGSRSGPHRGRMRLFAAAPGASFRPARPFLPGEHVTVRARWRDPAGAATMLTTSFTVATPVAIPPASATTPTGAPEPVQRFRSMPGLHPPAVTVRSGVTTSAAATSAADSDGVPSYLFVTPAPHSGQGGPMIFDETGELVWFDPLHSPERASDLRTQDLGGRDVLTWWQGEQLSDGCGAGEGVVANANYRTIATVRAGDGLEADARDFALTPADTAWILACSPVEADLRPVGGEATGVVLDDVIQEIDVRTGLVMWEWQSLGHVPLSDSYAVPAPGTPYDYLQIDSLDLDEQGNVLVSAANTSALYYIDGHSGEVLWSLGGKHSSFTLGAGVTISEPQEATVLRGGGDVSLLDAARATPPTTTPARSEVLKLDRGAGSATLAGALEQPAATPVATAGGDAQALPGGGWMIGWGEGAAFTEFDAAGDAVFEAQLPAADPSYRVYREPWTGQPARLPQLTELNADATSTVYASWNGATTATSWQLLTGSSPAHMAAVSTTPWSGFQTTIPAPGAAYYKVQALSASGRVLATSRVIPAGRAST